MLWGNDLQEFMEMKRDGLMCGPSADSRATTERRCGSIYWSHRRRRATARARGRQANWTSTSPIWKTG